MAEDIQDVIKRQVVEAMRAGDTARRDLLKVALGELQTGDSRKGAPLTPDESVALIRKIIKSNQETLAARDEPEIRAKVEFENGVLQALLPQTLDADAIVDALAPVADAIQSAGNDGMATGLAMKHLKSIGAAVQGGDVAAAVKRMRAG